MHYYGLEHGVVDWWLWGERRTWHVLPRFRAGRLRLNVTMHWIYIICFMEFWSLTKHHHRNIIIVFADTQYQLEHYLAVPDDQEPFHVCMDTSAARVTTTLSSVFASIPRHPFTAVIP